jgi:hypothetical protein
MSIRTGVSDTLGYGGPSSLGQPTADATARSVITGAFAACPDERSAVRHERDT